MPFWLKRDPTFALYHLSSVHAENIKIIVPAQFRTRHDFGVFISWRALACAFFVFEPLADRFSVGVF
jgi:hypothetical protein